jgi:hypothetical protein
LLSCFRGETGYFAAPASKHAKSTPGSYNSALKETLEDKCDPHSSTGGGGTGDDGVFVMGASGLLMLFSAFLVNYNFWL